MPVAGRGLPGRGMADDDVAAADDVVIPPDVTSRQALARGCPGSKSRTLAVAATSTLTATPDPLVSESMPCPSPGRPRRAPAQVGVLGGPGANNFSGVFSASTSFGAGGAADGDIRRVLQRMPGRSADAAPLGRRRAARPTPRRPRAAAAPFRGPPPGVPSRGRVPRARHGGGCAHPPGAHWPKDQTQAQRMRRPAGLVFANTSGGFPVYPHPVY